MIIQNNNKIQLTTKPGYGSLIENLVKQEFHEELTPAAQETLAIVAYAGPLSRTDVEYVRGVNSSFILRSLLLRGLIDRSLDPRRANAYIYNISFECLKHLGLKTVSELPNFEKYKILADQFKKQQ